MTDEDALDDAAVALRIGPGALSDLLARRLKRRPGYDLLTILAPGDEGRCLVRLYSSDLARYPLGDADIVEDNKWFRRLFIEREPVIANDAFAIHDWLPDFFTADASGYGSLVNLPVVIAGESVGLVNMMATAGHFSEDNVEAIRREIPLAALAVLTRRPPLAGNIAIRLGAIE
ncbi:MAG TPA: GAF domain-containing protein [Roseiarcus sp.]|nr:GAF domain-containing protein [Roseiarcus sp.]